MGNSPEEALQNELGSVVSTDPRVCYEHAFDGLKIAFTPQAVIMPTEREQIGTTLKLANQWKVPVTVRGAGSTLTGGATPVKAGWVINMTQLNNIHVDAENQYAEAQAGAVLKDIQDKVEGVGLFYPPDPSSHKWCTIGGNIACNAGGLRCVKYGVTRDYVLALKGYLPTGEFVEWGRNVKKFATGFNIRDLWIGSEGCLGVVTDVTLRLIEKPEAKLTFLAGFSDEEKALKASLEILQSGIRPSIMEFIDALSVQGASLRTGYSFFPEINSPAVLLIEIDGNSLQLENERLKLENQLTKLTPYTQVAHNEQDAEKLWEVRRKCSGAMFRLGNSKLNEDVVVPLSKMVKLVSFIRDLRKRLHDTIAVFGHAGDGNLHVNIMYDRDNSTQSKNAEQALEELMHEVIRLGGAISGEHGVGLAKSEFMDAQFSATELQLMQQIKRTFDPNGILNPGKLFEVFKPWEYQKQDYQFPWDKK